MKSKTPLYRKVDGSEYRNVYIMGDLHGCYSLLEKELKRIKFDKKKDLLIATGDLVDRGEDSLKCLRLINEPWFKTVVGNHEDMMIESLYHNEQALLVWLNNGGMWWVNSPKKEQTESYKHINKLFVESCYVLELSIDGKTVVICHSDYPEDKYEYDQPVETEMVIWDRDRSVMNKKGYGCAIKGADLFVFGHTPAESVTQYYNQLYIDTGSCFVGKLTIINVRDYL